MKKKGKKEKSRERDLEKRREPARLFAYENMNKIKGDGLRGNVRKKYVPLAKGAKKEIVEEKERETRWRWKGAPVVSAIILGMNDRPSWHTRSSLRATRWPHHLIRCLWKANSSVISQQDNFFWKTKTS